MNILDEIIQHKRKEVQERKELYPTKLLERSIYFASPSVSLKSYLLREDRNGIIAEIKRKSPSKGFINKYISIEQTSIGYMQAGASALSILTDKDFFGGSSEDLTTARKFNYCPILRKDFIVDEYQIIEAKSIGADAILLIAAVLDANEIQQLTALAHSLQLEVLFEVKNKEELQKLHGDIDVIGVNNRNLDTMIVDVAQSFSMIEDMPKDMVKISESGIDNPEVLIKLREVGYNGFLIGEAFMKHSRPWEACATLINAINQTKIIA